MDREIRGISITTILFMVYAWLPTSISAQEESRYATEKLALMASQLHIQKDLDTLQSGVYIDQMKCAGKPITVIVRSGRVEHIGHSVFSASQRKAYPSPVYNFLERYSLEMTLPLKPKITVAQRLVWDRVSFTKGSLDDLTSFYGDTTLVFRIINHDERAYSVEWRRDGELVCGMFFPSNYELLHGSNLIENENRLEKEIANIQFSDIKPADVTMKDVVPADSCSDHLYTGDYFVQDLGCNRIPAMVNRRFYQLAKDSVEGDSIGRVADKLVVLCSTRYPVESVANLFSCLDIQNDYMVEVSQLKYNFQKITFVAPLCNLIGYFLSEGCKPYFGLIDYNEENGMIEAFVEMRNHEEAYEHLLHIKMDTSTLEERRGTISVSLTGYVLTHDIENLYDDENLND